MAVKADQRTETPREEVLAAISTAICTKREEAIKGRMNSHIETIWTEDDEFYQGFDKANRHEFKTENSKPTEGGRATEPKKRKGSTLFPNITAPYVDMASAKIADMLMGAADWRSFEVKPTPVPKLITPPPLPTPAPTAMPAMPGAPQGAAPGLAGAGGPPNAAAIMGNPAAPGQPMTAPAPAMPGQPTTMGASMGMSMAPLSLLMEKLKAVHAKAVDCAQRAEDAIDDALVECQFEDEMREVIHDAARLGTGIIKGPMPEKRKARVAKRDEQTGEYSLDVEITTEPGSKRINPLHLYPDFPACGEDVHNGNFMLEFAPCTEKQLRGLKGGSGPAQYLDDQIDQCLEEGPNKVNETPGNGQPLAEGNFPRWYFYGVLKGKDIVTAGCQCDDEEEMYPVIATLVNDRIVKVALNPLEANEFPYDFLVWKKRSGMPWGVGVARQARVGQRIATAGLRNLMDNAGAAARPHKVSTDAIVQGADPWTWKANTEINDVRGAMQFFVQPSLQPELERIVERGLRQVELETGLPMTILGMEGQQQETAHGRTILNNNGSTVLRRIARNFDAATESHVRRYYRWLLLYSNDESVKGDVQIQARGSSSLVERDMQSQQLPQMIQMFADPKLGKSQSKAVDELLRSWHFDPKNFDMDDAEKAAMMARPIPVAPIVQATQLKEAGATQRKQMDIADAQQERAQDAQGEEADRQLQLVLGQVKERIESIKDQGAREIAFNDLKAMLASVTIKVQAQRAMSTQDAAAHVATHQVMHPAVEPVGRAPAGQAFEQ